MTNDEWTVRSHLAIRHSEFVIYQLKNTIDKYLSQARH